MIWVSNFSAKMGVQMQRVDGYIGFNKKGRHFLLNKKKLDADIVICLDIPSQLCFLRLLSAQQNVSFNINTPQCLGVFLYHMIFLA